MPSPRWRKVLRDLWSNKTRTFLVVLSIAVGVFAVGMIAGTQAILAVDLPVAYNSVNPSSATLYTAPFDDELLQTVRRMDGILMAEGRRRATVRIKVGPDQWRDLRLEANDKYDEIQVDQVRPESGAWPPPDRQLLMERNSLPLTNAKVGDTVLVELPDGKQRELRIAGLVHDLNKPPAAFVGWVSGYVTFDTFEWLGFPRNFTELHIVVSEDRLNKQHITAMAERVKEKVEKGGRTVYFSYIPAPGEHPANQIIQTFLLILGALGGLSLFLSGFLVVNTIMAILTQQVKQIGVMKAVGARTDQVMGMYLGGVVVYGLLSLLVAVPLGGLGAYYFAAFIASLINYNMSPFRIPLETFVLEVAVGLIVPLLAALAPVFAGARVTVREAISTYGLGRGRFGQNIIDRMLEQVRFLSRPLLLSLRNTFRRKARLALTLFTLTLGGAIFIAVLTVQSSLATTLNDALAYWQYDIDVDLNQNHRIEQILREAKQVPGVVEAESWLGTSVRRVRPDGRQGPDMSLIAPPAETKMLKPVVLDGRWLLAEDENAVVLNTEVTKEESDLSVDDEIKLKIDNKDSSWRVVGIVRGILTGPIMYANYSYFAKVVHNPGRANSVQIVTAQHDPAFQTAVATQLKDHFDNSGLRVRRSTTITQQRQNIEYQFALIVVFMAIMAVLLAIVGGLGLMGTMSINVLERSREIGVMRAIGAANRSVLQIFMVEGLLIGVLSWMLGGLLSLPISKLLSDVVGIAFMRAPLSFSFSSGGALFWLGLVMVLAALASFLPSWRAMKLSVREVLAYE